MGAGSVIAARMRDVRGALGFYTRLPVRCDDAAPGSLAFAPLAGLAVGSIAASGLVLVSLIGLSPLAAAAAAVLILTILSGALHEDGLADTCDALGARDRARRLDIMRDSRIGTYGVCALIASLGLRTVLIAEIAAHDVGAAAAVLVGAAAFSRALTLWPSARLPNARDDGLGAWTASIGARELTTALILAGPIVAVAGVIGGVAVPSAIAALAALAAAEATARGARRAFGGQTGDVAGATQQICDLAFSGAAAMSLLIV